MSEVHQRAKKAAQVLGLIPDQILRDLAIAFNIEYRQKFGGCVVQMAHKPLAMRVKSRVKNWSQESDTALIFSRLWWRNF